MPKKVSGDLPNSNFVTDEIHPDNDDAETVDYDEHFEAVVSPQEQHLDEFSDEDILSNALFTLAEQVEHFDATVYDMRDWIVKLLRLMLSASSPLTHDIHFKEREEMIRLVKAQNKIITKLATAIPDDQYDDVLKNIDEFDTVTEIFNAMRKRSQTADTLRQIVDENIGADSEGDTPDDDTN